MGFDQASSRTSYFSICSCLCREVLIAELMCIPINKIRKCCFLSPAQGLVACSMAWLILALEDLLSNGCWKFFQEITCSYLVSVSRKKGDKLSAQNHFTQLPVTWYCPEHPVWRLICQKLQIPPSEFAVVILVFSNTSKATMTSSGW